MDDTNSHDFETCASPPCATTPRTAPTFTSSDVSVRFSDVSVSSRSPPPFSAPRSFPAPTSCNPTQILATIRSRRIDRHPSDLIGNTQSRDVTERLFYMNSSAMSTGAHKHMLETLEKIRVEMQGLRHHGWLILATCSWRGPYVEAVHQDHAALLRPKLPYFAVQPLSSDLHDLWAVAPTRG